MVVLHLPPNPPALVDVAQQASISTLAELREDLGHCIRVVRGNVRSQVTVRFSLRRDGSFFGQPRITSVAAAVNDRERELIRAAAVRAIEGCAPFPLTPGLGEALAGRLISVTLLIRSSEQAI